MKSLITASLITLLSSYSAHAVEMGGFNVTGEAAFDYTFFTNKGQGVAYTDQYPHETYRFRNAQLLLSKETDEISFTARLNYFTRTFNSPTDISDPSSPTVNNSANFGGLDQIEVYYKPMPGLKIGVGRFLTTMGTESVLKYENATYTPTIAYQSIIPGYGEGLRAIYSPLENLNLNLSTYNTATYDSFGDTDHPTKTTEISAGGSWEKLTWFAGYYFGTDPGTTEKEDKTATGIWVSYPILESLKATLTYDSKTLKTDSTGLNWASSSALHMTYSATAKYDLSVRYEMIGNASFLGYGTAENLNSAVLSNKFKLSPNFNLYLEYRLDSADEEVFADSDGTVNKKSTDFLTLGALAYF